MLQQICDQIGVQVNFRIFGWPVIREPYIRADNIENVTLRARAYLALRRGLYSAIRRCDVICDITGGDSFTDMSASLIQPRRFGQSNRPDRRPTAAAQPADHWSVPTRLDAVCGDTVDAACASRRLPRHADYRISGSIGTQRERRRCDRRGLSAAVRSTYRRAQKTGSGRHQYLRLAVNGGYTRNNMFALTVDYPILARVLIEYFAARSECEVHLISHVISDTFDVEDDYRVAQRLAKDTPGVVVAPRFKTPSEAKSYIATMDFFCGARMHACIAAFSSGVPVLPIAYSRKFAGVFGSLGYLHVADCQSSTAERIMESVIEAFATRDFLRQSVKNALAKADAKLAAYEAVARDAFSKRSEKGLEPVIANSSASRKAIFVAAVVSRTITAEGNTQCGCPRPDICGPNDRRTFGRGGALDR